MHMQWRLIKKPELNSSHCKIMVKFIISIFCFHQFIKNKSLCYFFDQFSFCNFLFHLIEYNLLNRKRDIVKKKGVWMAEVNDGIKRNERNVDDDDDSK